jgi:transposase, IS5 family
MQLQGSVSQAEYAGKKKQTRRDRFLAGMEQVVPWTRLVDRLRPFYPKGEREGRRLGWSGCRGSTFWYTLVAAMVHPGRRGLEALYDSQALRGFTGIDLSMAAVPDATTVLNFRHWLDGTT